MIQYWIVSKDVGILHKDSRGQGAEDSSEKKNLI